MQSSPATDVAVAFETDWAPWGFGLAIAILVLAIVWASVNGYVAAAVSDGLEDRAATAAWAVWGLFSLASLTALLVVPGMIMRHIPSQPDVAWVFYPSLAGAAALGIWGLLSDIRLMRWSRWIGALSLALGALAGAATDWLNRVASSIPTSVPALIGLIILGAIVLILWARER
ncbi:hypothetical protein NS220_14240 [Microbacterium testaceum]|uniref:Uncharacterized protein n=1 Tax=Microbacterium testaceum TaxID=2033 RepID=A0A147EUQ8_MICTE|nr:hypothetical protein [Microbacterium testaceum]KTR92596.1 hypothetical protein NS220_14240 [Microbacterium testaceum]